eukprot:g646.t1
MAFTFAKVAGVPIGSSILDENGAKLVPEIFALAKEKNVKIHLPTDYVTASAFDADAQVGAADNKTGIPNGWMGLDIGPQTVSKFSQVLKSGKTVVWNGPMGVFEFEKFAVGTKRLLEAAAEAVHSGTVVVVGGGDTATSARKFGFEEMFSHVSTGGGASLELLEGKELPGVAFLRNINNNDK